MGSLVKKYIWIVTLLTVVIISYLLAKITALALASRYPDIMIAPRLPKSVKQAEAGQTQKEADLEAILRRNFFDAQESKFASVEESSDESGEAAAVATAADGTTTTDSKNQVAVKTSLEITLISTVSLGNGTDPLNSCVVRTGREEDVYRVGGDPSFATGVKIVRILPKRVDFLNKGRLEYVELVDFAKGIEAFTRPEPPPTLGVVRKQEITEEAPTGDIQRNGNAFQIPRAEVDKALANLSRLYTDIRAVPYFKDGKANGFKLLNVKQGSLFEKLGLRRGDILKAINGNVLDIATGMQLFNNLKNETHFTMDVERRGSEQTFNYDII